MSLFIKLSHSSSGTRGSAISNSCATCVLDSGKSTWLSRRGRAASVVGARENASIASFVAPDEPDLYVWIRRFDSEEEAERLYKEVYESDYWKTEIKPQADEMLDRERMRITRLEATPKSVIR